ncbi:RNA polymerase sigma-32 factor [Azospirillaceae bacterium]
MGPIKECVAELASEWTANSVAAWEAPYLSPRERSADLALSAIDDDSDVGAGSGGPLIRLARRQPLLTAAEEQALARRAAAGDSRAAERLIISHLRVVIRVARRYARFGLPLGDLIQEGTLGLIRAVGKFNPDYDARLSTYAMWWVRAAIQEHVVRSWSLVRVGKTAAHRSLFFHLRRLSATGLLSGATSDSAPLAHLARHFRLPLAEVVSLATRITCNDLSLSVSVASASDAGRTHGADSVVEQIPAEQPTPEEVIVACGMNRLWSGLIDRALALLPPREATIIRRRHMTDAVHTFEAIGRELGLSKDRVRQLERRALERLHELLYPLVATHGFPG